MAGPQKKSLDRPDDRLVTDALAASIVRVGEAAISRVVFQPGGHCSQAPPSGGRRSCQAHHSGTMLSGQVHVEMDDGAAMDLQPNDVFEIPPGHDGWAVGDQPAVVLNWSGVRSWLPPAPAGERVLATLLFTDIVASTETLVRLGDAGWLELLSTHNQEVRTALDHYRGRAVKTTGDGFLAAFDSAVRAIKAAVAIRNRAIAAGLHVRAGVHTGEVERMGDDLTGQAVHEAARIAASAGPDQILVSSTTFQLASGSDVHFEVGGAYRLKGLAEARTLYPVKIAPQ